MGIDEDDHQLDFAVDVGVFVDYVSLLPYEVATIDSVIHRELYCT